MTQAPVAFLVVDAIDPESGLAEVEFSEGFTAELPLWWLPEPAEGAAYLLRREGDALHFTPFPGGARALRERSKQALLNFRDEFGE